MKSSRATRVGAAAVAAGGLTLAAIRRRRRNGAASNGTQAMVPAPGAGPPLAGEAGMSRVISPGDGMYDGNDQHYFGVTLSAGRSIALALEAAGMAAPGSILDFGCGHGRVMRLLRHRYPGAAITACDVVREGVDFCAATFQATPIYSSTRPEEIEVGGPFDLIWCGSLFTHLDQDRWQPILRFLTDRLSDGGVLVFTTHGRRVAHWLVCNDVYGLDPRSDETLLAAYRSSGFGYCDYAGQSWYEGGPGYGVSVSSPAWVVCQLERFPEVRLLMVQEAAWDGHQDVVSVVKDSAKRIFTNQHELEPDQEETG